MKRFMRIFLGFVLAVVAIHAVASHSIFESFALLSIGLIAADSLFGAVFGTRVLANYGGNMWMRPNRNDVVGWGLSNLTAPLSDPISALGNLIAHPSLGNLGHLVASPFEGVGQMFGLGAPGANFAQTFQGAPMGQPPGAAAYLPAPVPSLGQGMVQAHAGHMNPRAIVSYMGLGTTNWTGTDAGVKTLNPEPQAPFIGNRLVLVQNRSAGAVGRQVVISSPLTVSGVPQTPAPNVPAPIEMFAQDATYSSLQIQIAAAGTAISISFAIDAAPGGTDFVNLSAGMYGYWLR